MTDLISAIVPAAGSGTRLAADVPAGPPKALRALAGEPLLRHAIRSIEHVVGQVVVPAAPDMIPSVRAAVGTIEVPVVVVEGGPTREQSVRRAVAALDASTAHVLVHDAARPLCPPGVTDRVVAALRAGADAVVPVVEVVDTLRRTGGGSSATVDRSQLRLVQTPQGFTVDTLRRAHEAAAAAGVSATAATDDASLAERIGVPVVLVDGDPLAFKVTRALDLALAEAVLAQST